MGRHRLDEDDAERLAARLGSDIDAGACEQGFLLLVADSSQEGYRITKALDRLTDLRGVSSSGNQETSARETLEHTSDGTGKNAQALAGLIEAAEEHDDRTFIGCHPLVKGLRGAERGRLDPVRNDDGIAAVMLDQRSTSLLGYGDAHSDAFHVQAHGSRRNCARDRPAEGRVECSHERGARQHRGRHGDRGNDRLMDVHDIEIVISQPTASPRERLRFHRNIGHRSVERD